MASVIEIVIDGSHDEADRAVAIVDQVFGRFEHACSRFLQDSELNVYCNSSEPMVLSEVLASVIEAAYVAYLVTGGRFDPRVRGVLESLGYDRTFSLLEQPPAALVVQSSKGNWANPVLTESPRLFSACRETLDLGGIAKGAALQAVAGLLGGEKFSGVVSAGGDVVVVGQDTLRSWPIALEDPIPGSIDPIATVEVCSGAVMTSSVRVRQWRAGTKPVHHLIDPSTGAPGGAGLAAVTMMGQDPVTCEVWSKALFLRGGTGALAEANERGLAMVAVTREGDVAISDAALPLVTWVRPK